MEVLAVTTLLLLTVPVGGKTKKERRYSAHEKRVTALAHGHQLCRGAGA